MIIVKFVLSESDLKYESHYPFKVGEHLLYLGEIGNMKSHCAVVNKEGKTFWGYHNHNFLIIDDEDM